MRNKGILPGSDNKQHGYLVAVWTTQTGVPLLCLDSRLEVNQGTGTQPREEFRIPGVLNRLCNLMLPSKGLSIKCIMLKRVGTGKHYGALHGNGGVLS